MASIAKALGVNIYTSTAVQQSYALLWSLAIIITSTAFFSIHFVHKFIGRLLLISF